MGGVQGCRAGAGRALRYFAVGDVLTVATPRWTIEYEVTGFDQVEPADAALTHSMTLLPVRLVTNLQFDAPEPGNPDANRAQYGCNRWDWSAIRQWMNSAPLRASGGRHSTNMTPPRPTPRRWPDSWLTFPPIF